jgi:cytochrome P450
MMDIESPDGGDGDGRGGERVRRTAPVTAWESDFDVLDPGYIADPFKIWEELRAKCPIAHTDRRGSTWLPTRYEDVTAIAHDVVHFSSLEVAVIPFEGEEPEEPVLPYGLPPISADPPLHTWTRRLLLPWFSHQRVESYEAMTRGLCSGLIDGFLAEGRADAASDYAQQIPVRVIAHILGVSPDLSDTFTGWVRDVLEFADDHDRRVNGVQGLLEYFIAEVAKRRAEPGDDLLSELMHTEVDGAPIEDSLVLGSAALVLIAGVDTTWSAIGSSLWHLATHPVDRKRLVEDPDVMPLAVEELLRAYAPVTMARLVTTDVEYAGCPMKAGDKILMNFPAANRDPEVFENADDVVLDRAHNRHVAFGSGIHRCAGSNLARMELRVALEEWLRRIPEFRVAEGDEVTWAGGQVRGPRVLPVVFP